MPGPNKNSRIPPSLLVFDEPFSALDYVNKVKLWSKIEDIRRREGLTTFLLPHNLKETLYRSDVIIFLGKNPVTITQETRVDIDRPRALKGGYRHKTHRHTGAADRRSCEFSSIIEKP